LPPANALHEHGRLAGVGRPESERTRGERESERLSKPTRNCIYLGGGGGRERNTSSVTIGTRPVVCPLYTLVSRQRSAWVRHFKCSQTSPCFTHTHTRRERERERERAKEREKEIEREEGSRGAGGVQSSPVRYPQWCSRVQYSDYIGQSSRATLSLSLSLSLY